MVRGRGGGTAARGDALAPVLGACFPESGARLAPAGARDATESGENLCLLTACGMW